MSGTTYNAAYEAQELAYLEQTEHFTAAGAAGALGNLQQESDFNPNAVQAGTGASGIGQWQNGRLDALKAFAAARHTSYTDLSTQLAFMGHELATSYRNVLKAGQSATDPAGYAALWNADYEISADTSNTRETNAQNIYAQIGKGTLQPTQWWTGTQPSTGSAETSSGVGGIEGFALKGVFALTGLVLVVMGAYVTAKPAREKAEQVAQSVPVPVE